MLHTLCDDARQWNRTVVAGTVFVSLFENWGNVSFLPVIRNLPSLEWHVKYNLENGGNFMAEFFQNSWGYQIWTCGFMRFQVGEQFLDAGGRYSDVWHRGVGTGPFVRKRARCFFRENWGELIIKYFCFAWCLTEGLTLASKRRDAGRIFAKMFKAKQINK